MAERDYASQSYPDKSLEPIVRALAEAKHVVVVTGSGVSAASGIPTFRDALAGVWAKFDPAELATFQAFKANPSRVSRWYELRRRQCLQCQPNAAHHALAKLEDLLSQRGASMTLLTQNVDRLHQRAGSEHVHELHGSLFRWPCTRCSHAVELLDAKDTSDNVRGRERSRRCEKCDGLLRPGVVWFGEMLPMDVMQIAEASLVEADVFMSIGTSSVVHPVARFIDVASQHARLTVEINPDPTPISSLFNLTLRRPSEQVLPAILAEHQA